VLDALTSASKDALSSGSLAWDWARCDCGRFSADGTRLYLACAATLGAGRTTPLAITAGLGVHSGISQSRMRKPCSWHFGIRPPEHRDRTKFSTIPTTSATMAQPCVSIVRTNCPSTRPGGISTAVGECDSHFTAGQTMIDLGPIISGTENAPRSTKGESASVGRRVDESRNSRSCRDGPGLPEPGIVRPPRGVFEFHTRAPNASR